MTQPHLEFRSVGRVRSALANAAVYRILSQLAGAAVFVLLVRIMTEHDYGIYSIFYSLPVVMGAVLSLGIGNALHRFLPEYFSVRNFALARHFVRWALRLRLLTSVVFLSLCYAFWDYLAPIFDVAGLKSQFLIFIAVVITLFQSRILTLALSANLMQQWSSGLSAAFALLKLIGYMVASRVHVSLETILTVDLVASLLWYAALRYAYHTRIPQPAEASRAKFPADERKRVLRYAAFYNFNDIGVVALGVAPDRLFVAAFMNPIAVGAYAFCTGMNLMIQKLLPVTFFNGVIEPLVFTLDYAAKKSRATHYFQLLVKLNYLVQFPIVVLVTAVPAQIISVIFAGKFLEYEYLLIAAFVFPATYAFMVPATIIAQLGERAGIILASKLFAVYNIVAAVILIPPFGVYGAIAATGTAQLFKSIFIWFFVRRIATFRGTGRFFLTQIVVWSSCLAILKVVTRDMADLLALITAVVVVGFFALLGLRLSHFNHHESNLIRKVSGSRASRVLEYAGVIAK